MDVADLIELALGSALSTAYLVWFARFFRRRIASKGSVLAALNLEVLANSGDFTDAGDLWKLNNSLYFFDNSWGYLLVLALCAVCFLFVAVGALAVFLEPGLGPYLGIG